MNDELSEELEENLNIHFQNISELNTDIDLFLWLKLDRKIRIGVNKQSHSSSDELDELIK